MTENTESVSSESVSGTSTDVNKTQVKEEKPNSKSKEKTTKQWYHGRKKSGYINNHSSTTRVNKPEFKGTIKDMNGHTFQCHGESTTASQFSQTYKKLQCYKYGDDVAFIVHHFKEYNMNKNKPSPAPSNADTTDLCIMDKEVDEYVK